MLLHGATGEIAAKALESFDIGPEDWAKVFRSDYRTMRDAFHAPGALGRTVSHPGLGDIPATMLFDLGLVESAVHGWDLARAIGADAVPRAEMIIDGDGLLARGECIQIPMPPGW